MSTLTTLKENIADLADAMEREKRMAIAERDGLLATINVLREGLNELEQRVVAMTGDRVAVLANMIGGNGGEVPAEG